jgi:N-acetylglucosamine-6-phosphate deacetylase
MQLSIINALIPQSNNLFLKGHICIDKGKIKALLFTETTPFIKNTEIIDADGYIACPGFIDTHNHGGNGYGFDCEEDGWRKIEQRLSSSGVTSVLATWESSPLDDTFRFIDRVKSISNNNAVNNVEIAGIHLEGPYINKAKKGMHQEEFIRPANMDEVRLILEKTGSFLKIISVAPEIDMNMAVIKTLAAAGVSVSVAHTEADYDTALAAFSAGATRVTHAFNAMPALNQRYKGIITAAWQHGAFMELIADNHHVSPTIMKMFVSAADHGKIVLVSDNNECSGLPEGSYTIHGRQVIVTGGGLKNESGILAGSVAGLNQCAHNITRCGFNAWEALKMACENPARSIGIFDRKGSIAEGKDADLVILDGQFNVYMTIKSGRIVYRNEKLQNLS